MKKLALFIILLSVTFGRNAISQRPGQSFLRIDSIYLPKDKKGRLELNFTRFLKDKSYLSSALDFEVNETFFGYNNALKITDIRQIPDTHNIIMHVSYGTSDQTAIFRRVNEQINNINKKKISGYFTPILISDSLNFYKILKGKKAVDTASIRNFVSSPYLLNINQLHTEEGNCFENACYLYFINSDNIGNSDATIDKVMPSNTKKYVGNAAPVIVPYLMEEIEIPAYLKNYILKTPCPYDTIITDPNLTRFHRIFQRILISNFNFKYALTLDTRKPNYKGEPRILNLLWKGTGLKDTISYSFGSSDYPLNIKELSKDWIFWLSCIFFGILFLLSVFFVLSILYPFLEEKRFVKKYVSPYFPINNIVKLDTMTNEPIEKGSLVVTRCKEIVPYYIWKGLGNQCPSYPECMDYLGCDGCGKSDINYKFFSQSGNMKKFNWLFYGTCGGFIAWMLTLLIIPLLSSINFGGIFVGLYDSTVNPNTDLYYFKENIVHQTSIGFGIGLGLGAALIMADYFSSIIRPHLAISISKIILCGIINAFIFGLINALTFKFQINPFLSGFIGWTFFAIILSLALSISSPSIHFKRSIIATSAGVLLSFFIYHLSSELTNIGYKDFSSNRQLFIEFINILRLIVLGGLTGYIVTNVLNKLEEYELTLQSPDQVSGRVIPISKILNSRATVTIGSSPKNVIFIKWTDPGAEESHASINLTNEGVVLTSHAEIIINKEYLSKGSRHLLKDKDVIQLGRHSSTLMQFNIKYT